MISEHTKSSNSCKGRDTFWIRVINRLLYCLIIQLMEWYESYKHVGKYFNFLWMWHEIWARITSKLQDRMKTGTSVTNWQAFFNRKSGSDWMLQKKTWSSLKFHILYVRDIHSSWPKFDKNSKMNWKWTNNELLEIINNNKTFLSLLAKKLNYPSVFSIENITKLSNEAFKE